MPPLGSGLLDWVAWWGARDQADVDWLLDPNFNTDGLSHRQAVARSELLCHLCEKGFVPTRDNPRDVKLNSDGSASFTGPGPNGGMSRVDRPRGKRKPRARGTRGKNNRGGRRVRKR